MNVNTALETKDKIRALLSGARGVNVVDVKDAGSGVFTVVSEFNSQPVHGHRDSAWIISNELKKKNIEHRIEGSSEDTAIGDGLNGRYGTWKHLVAVRIHNPESIVYPNINEEVMLDLKNSIDENRILEMVHKRFYEEHGRDPKNAKELLSYARKKNGKTNSSCEGAIKKHEKEMHEGVVGQVANVLNEGKRGRALARAVGSSLNADTAKALALGTAVGAGIGGISPVGVKTGAVAGLTAGLAGTINNVRKKYKDFKREEDDLEKWNNEVAASRAKRGRIDEIFDNTIRGHNKALRYIKRQSKDWETNIDAKKGVEQRIKDGEIGEYFGAAKAAEYQRQINKRSKGMKMLSRKLEKRAAELD